MGNYDRLLFMLNFSDKYVCMRNENVRISEILSDLPCLQVDEICQQRIYIT